MYIDKFLVGVLVVQFLLCLNCVVLDLFKCSEDFFILDFYNKKDDMEESFNFFYIFIILFEFMDVNIFYELCSILLFIGVFDEEDIN